jgi:hypothetical protein
VKELGGFESVLDVTLIWLCFFAFIQRRGVLLPETKVGCL